MFAEKEECLHFFQIVCKNEKMFAETEKLLKQNHELYIMGRKPFGRLFEGIVLSCLDENIPKTIESIRKEVAAKLGKPGLSWHTVKKYIDFLVEARKVEEIRAGKITTYRLRR